MRKDSPLYQEILSRLRKGQNVAQITSQLKCTVYKVKKVCLENNIRYPKVEKRDIVFQTIKMLQEGYEDSDIVSKLFVSRQRINGIRQKAEKYHLISR